METPSGYAPGPPVKAEMAAECRRRLDIDNKTGNDPVGEPAEAEWHPGELQQDAGRGMRLRFQQQRVQSH